MTRALRVVAISDTHNKHHQIQVPSGDILICAGDFTNHGDLNDVMRFDQFLLALPHRHKIAIAGNHDFCFERTPQQARALLTSCHYLEDSAVQIEGLTIYGSPWQPEFNNWAFNLPRGQPLREKWDRIDPHTDILVTHGPPYGYRDATSRGEHAGCRELLRAVERVKPHYHIFGHIHEGAGTAHNAHTKFLNASVCTLTRKPINPPLVFDIEV